jgi:hypothetical protein
MADAESERLHALWNDDVQWRRWGPYLAERAWGTVREDYSAGGDAWGYFTHDHARSRAYRWNEDGMAGVCDDQQTLCLGLALWNGRDPFLKERMFGLSGPEGNHGEDVKECWWYLDATPTASWLRWRYHYPQCRFPYDELVDENGRRGHTDPEFELLDTGAFDHDRFWSVTVDYAKASPDDICMRVVAVNAGPDTETLHVLPTVWLRNTWAWAGDTPVAKLRADGGKIVIDHPHLGTITLASAGSPQMLFCDNETNSERLFGTVARSPFPKDGINDHVVNGRATINPAQIGTKAAFHHIITVAPGQRVELRLRLSGGSAPDLGTGFSAAMVAREDEADDFYAARTPDRASRDEALVLRQALAGMLWSQQFFHFDVERWLDGDPGQPPPPAERLTGRNAGWRHLNNHDVISMPDTWEYPWYAAWDLAFHCVALASVDAELAKRQLLLLCREWFMHPNGQLPAYEWSFSDVNPPVHAWAALRVFELDGRTDYDFLERAFHKLLLNFTWWVNRKDTEGNNVFEGGFLGLDNIGPFDRSTPLPNGDHLEQSDGTAWMAMYCLDLLQMALVLADHDHTYEDVATKFFEHFTYIAMAMNTQGLWDEQDGFYYDLLHAADGRRIPLRARSMIGLIPLYAVAVLDHELIDKLPGFASRMRWFLEHKPAFAGAVTQTDSGSTLLSIADPDRLRRVLVRMLDEEEFLSPHGLRALSRRHRDTPFETDIDGTRFRVDYEPAESTSELFGGNSNWRGPVWFPVNFLAVEALRRFHGFLGDGYTVEHPTGSGEQHTLAEVADDLSARLIGLFLRGADGRRPIYGATARLQSDPSWRDLLLFHEYFNGDDGAGLGASHQTGWTGLVADLIRHRHR